jgi:CRISPR-associated protein Csm3
MTTTPSVAPAPRLEAVLTLSATIRCETGLRIGAAESTIAIGGLDNPVIRSPLSGEPYIPGSSLKGKIRSLLERRYELPQNWGIDRGRVQIHVCEQEAAYRGCPVCPVFGIAAPQQGRWFCLTRLRVPDVALTEAARGQLEEKATDFPYTEVKTEVAIDRLTSAATPRSMERVPAGAEFGPAFFTLFRYAGDDLRRHLAVLVEGLELLEADYLGSAGSRGSGRITFRQIALERLAFPPGGGLPERATLTAAPLAGLRDLRAQFATLAQEAERGA